MQVLSAFLFRMEINGGNLMGKGVMFVFFYLTYPSTLCPRDRLKLLYSTFFAFFLSSVVSR